MKTSNLLLIFFTALGMMRGGEMPIEGAWVDRINGIEHIQVDIAMMRTPDGHGQLELTRFRNPKLIEMEPTIAPPNALGLRSVMFTIESVNDTVDSLRAKGGELISEIVQYEDKYKLCYMRGLPASSSHWPRNSSKARHCLRTFDSLLCFGNYFAFSLTCDGFCYAH